MIFPRVFSATVGPRPTPSFSANFAARLSALSRLISQLIPEANSSARREFDLISRESDPELLNEGLLNFGVRQENAGREELALAVFSALSDGALAARAQSRFNALLGHGSNQARLPVLLRRFLGEISSPSSLIGMAGAQAVFGLSRMALLSRITASPVPSILTRGAGARRLASSGAFLLEAPSFVAFSRGTRAALGQSQDWSLRALGHETAGSYLTLGSLRGSGALFGAIGRRIPALNPGLRPSLQTATTQAGMFGGILLSRELEIRAGLRERIDGATTLLDSLATLLQFHVTGHLVHRGLPRLAAFNRQLHWQGDSASQARPGASWFSRLPRWTRNLALAPLWLIMGARGDNNGEPLFGVPPEIDAIFREIETAGLEATRERMRTFTTDLQTPSVDPRRFVSSVQGLLEAGIEHFDAFGEEIWQHTMDLVATMNLRNRGPRAFLRHILERTQPDAMNPDDVSFHFALLRNRQLSPKSAQRMQNRLAEALRSDNPDMDLSLETLLQDIAHLVRSGSGPLESRTFLVREALAFARRNPDWFFTCDGGLLAETLLTEGHPLSEIEARGLIAIMTEQLRSPDLESSSRARLMPVLERLAIHPRSSSDIRGHIQARLSQIRRLFLEDNLEALQRGPQAQSPNFHEIQYLIAQPYVSEANYQTLSRGLLAAFWSFPASSIAYESAVNVAQTGLRNPRYSIEARLPLATILLTSLSDATSALRCEGSRETLQSLPRSELESYALRLSRDLPSAIEATRIRSQAALTQLIPMIGNSFALRGELSRLARQNRRPGMREVFQSLIDLLEH